MVKRIKQIFRHTESILFCLRFKSILIIDNDEFAPRDEKLFAKGRLNRDC